MAVSTRQEFLDVLARSNLLTAEQLRSSAELAAVSDDPRAIAKRIVEAGWLTRWQAQQLLAGRTKFFLGKYKLLEGLGQGGMGTVLKAEQPGLNRVVALKVMSREVLGNPDAVERFIREIRLAAALEHPHIVRAFDADCVGQTYFLVMEYVEGDELKAWIRQHGRLPISWASEVIRQAALGLQHAHEHGLAHRDIKPANLLVERRESRDVSGRVEGQESRVESQSLSSSLSTLDSRLCIKILDMGLAKFVTETHAEGGLTKTGQIMGTPDYMAPEQALSTRDADIRSDIFSLGCVLFEMLAGRVPFLGEGVMQKLMARTSGDAPRVSTLRPDLPPGLDEVVARMLAREAKQRYQTPSEVAAALIPFALATMPQIPQETVLLRPEPEQQTGRVEARADTTLNRFLNELDDQIIDAPPVVATPAIQVTPARNVPEPVARRSRRQVDGRWVIGIVGTMFAVVLIVALMLPGPASPRKGRANPPPPENDNTAVNAGENQHGGSLDENEHTAGTAINLLPRIQRRNVLQGDWTVRTDELESSTGVDQWLEVPYRMPAEYRLTSVVERRTGTNAFKAMLPVEGGWAHVIVDSSGFSGFWDVDGQIGQQIRFRKAEPALFATQTRRTITYTVRRDRVTVDCDDIREFAWLGDTRQLVHPQPEQALASADRRHVCIGSSNASFRITRLEVTPLETGASDEEWFDLLAGIDPQQHGYDGHVRANHPEDSELHWQRAGDAIRSPGRDWNRLLVPVAIRGDYELQVKFTPLPEGRGNHIKALLPIAGKSFAAQLGEKMKPLTSDPDVTLVDKPVLVPEVNRVNILEVLVRTTSAAANIVLRIDGKDHVRWQGPLEQLGERAWDQWTKSGLWLMPWASVVDIHSARVRLLPDDAGAAEVTTATFTAPDEHNGIKPVGADYEQQKLADKPALVAPDSQTRRIGFDVDDAVAHDVPADTRDRFVVRATVFDEKAGSVGLAYDSHLESPDDGLPHGNQHRRKLSGSGQWIELEFELEQPRLSGRFHGGADFHLSADNDHRLTVHSATLERIRVEQPGDEFTNALGMQFIRIPAGKSLLGGGGGKPGTRAVEFKDDFYLGKYEVTQHEWEKVMGNNPSGFTRKGFAAEKAQDVPEEELKRFPVERVSWDDCQQFVTALNKQLNEPGWVYRLPREAEWEYACRGGPMVDAAESAFSFYFDKPSNELLPDKANVNKQRCVAVGSYPPNRLGLYDMHGNVWEWCEELYDPAGPRRVMRGGAWPRRTSECTTAARGHNTPDYRNYYVGVRLARVPVAGAWQSLFNGKDLTGWHVERRNGGDAQVATTIDGQPAILVEKANAIPAGQFADYHLRFEFKTPDSASFGCHHFKRSGDNSGLGMHLHRLMLQGWNVVYDKAKLQGGGVIGEGKTVGHMAPWWLPQPDGYNPKGAWHRMEIIRLGDSYIYVLNGGVIGAVAGLRSVVDGEEIAPGETNLDFWSTTRKAYFRNIEIRAINALPPEVTDTAK